MAAAAEAARPALAILEMNIGSSNEITQRDRLVQVADQTSQSIVRAEELSASARTAVAA